MKPIDILLGSCILICSNFVSNTQGKKENDIHSPGSKRIIIDVTNDDPSSNLCLDCWSDSGRFKARKCFPPTSPKGLMSWKIKPHNSETHWCAARWGLYRIRQFLVYGGGVPLSSNTWVIDGIGKRRVSENGKRVNDFLEYWPEIPLTTEEESWAETTTEEIPISEGPIPTEDPITTGPPSEIPSSEDAIDPTDPPTTEDAITTGRSSEIPSTEDAIDPSTEGPTDPPTTEGPTGPPTTEGPTDTTTEDPGYEFECPSPSGNFQDPLDCSFFYTCDNGVVVGRLQCPDGLYFNPAIDNCDYPWNVDCPQGNERTRKLNALLAF